MSFKSSFGALEEALGSRLGFGILILIWIWSLVFDIPMIRILALYLDLKVKNIHVLSVLIWSFEGHWRFLPGGGHLDLDLDMVMVFDIPMIQILALYLDFEGAKNIYVLILGFGGCWRFLTRFGILILIWILSLVFGISIYGISAL